MKLTLETSNICQLSCHNNDRNNLLRPSGLMEISTLVNAVGRFQELGIEEIEFGGVGESLLNPNIVEFIIGCRRLSSKARLTLVTNGVLLTSNLGAQFVKAGLDSLTVILSPTHVPLTTPLRGSEKGKIYENITLVSKLWPRIKIIHALPSWSLEQRQIISKFWRMRGLQKVYFSSRLACGVMLGPSRKPPGHKPPNCILFREELYISWNGSFLSCCHDKNEETSLGNIAEKSLLEMLEKKKKIIDMQYFYPICYECTDDRRVSKKGIIRRTFGTIMNSILSA